MLRNIVKRKVKNAIKKLQESGELPEVKLKKVRVENPQKKDQGDYSSPIAMQIASFSGRKPKTIAKIIQKQLLQDESLKRFFSDIRVASPGFINFYISDTYLKKLLWKIIGDDSFSFINAGKNKKLNIEFASINPTGELHVGHARTFFYSDILANILQFGGFKVTREYYVNNARQSSQIKELGKTCLGKGTSYKSPYLDAKIKEYSKSLKKYKNFGVAGYFMAGKIQKDIKSLLLKDAGIKFDVWFHEEDLYKNGEVASTMRELEKKKLIYKKEGAIWLKTSKYGDRQDQVVVRSSGENTYFITDIAYHRNKARRKFEKIIDVWGADHHGHLRRMNSAFRILKIKNVDILIAQLVRLKGGAKLSKRAGTIVTVKDLLSAVGVDAVRYFYITKSLDSQMEFDIKLAKEQSQKNPVFYIQYTHARICSILRKAQTTTADGGIPQDVVTNHKLQISLKQKDLNALQEEGELNLIRKLVKFPEVIEDIVLDYQAHHLATYVFELSQEFNQFYRDFRVINEDKDIEQARLALSVATGIILKQCLDLLGISAPTKM